MLYSAVEYSAVHYNTVQSRADGGLTCVHGPTRHTECTLDIAWVYKVYIWQYTVHKLYTSLRCTKQYFQNVQFTAFQISVIKSTLHCVTKSESSRQYTMRLLQHTTVQYTMDCTQWGCQAGSAGAHSFASFIALASFIGCSCWPTSKHDSCMTAWQLLANK